MAPHASFGEGLPPELFFTLLTTPSVVRYARTPTGSSSFSTGRALTHQRSSPVRLRLQQPLSPCALLPHPNTMHILVPLLPRLVVVHLVLLRSPAVPHSTFLTPSPWLPRLLKSGGRRFISFYVYSIISGSFDRPRKTGISRLHSWIFTREKRTSFAAPTKDSSTSPSSSVASHTRRERCLHR